MPYRIATTLAVPAALSAALAATPLTLAHSAEPAPLQASPAPRSPLMVGVYVGELSHLAFAKIIVTPWRTDLQPSYLASLNLTYVAYRFERLPLSLEIDASVGKRFGQDHEWDFGIIPMARWRDLPWNSFLYTNIRMGFVGASYVTGISPWERRNSGNNRGSRYLNFMVPEVTFSSGPDAPWEAFVRIHHRSGGYGLINGVGGGSNYVSVGFRAQY